MGDMHDALNELAGRGTPRGFDDVFAAAKRDAAHAATPVDGSGGAADDLDPIPFVEAEPVARPRRPMHSAIAAAGVAALVLVGVLAVNAAVGSGGGAGSPEAAVHRLADAISHEDPLAAADVIAPEEVRSLRDTVSNAERRAAELKLVETAGAPLAGVDFDVAGLDLSSESLGDGVSKVTITNGEFRASTHKAQFSPLMQKALHGSKDNSAEKNLATLTGPDRPTFVVTVRRNGNWYVSAAYTLLEYVREVNDLPAADFGSGERAVATLGADSPDAAVQDAMHALQQRDWSKLLTLVAPDEIPAYDYRAALTALATRTDSTDGNNGWFTLDSLSTSAQVDGDHAHVTLHAAGTTDSAKWSVDGGCFAVTPNDTSEGSSFSYCDEHAAAYGLFLFPFSTVDRNTQVSLVRKDGRWFISPADTVLDSVNSWIDRLDQRTLYTMLGLPGLLPPDGPLVLGQPVTFGATDRGLRNLSLDAHKGEVLIGQGGYPIATDLRPQQGFVILRVYGPDGTEVYAAQALLDGQAFTVPADGRYTFAFQHFGSGAGSATVWNYADAPASVQQISPGGRSTCTYGPNESSCSSSGFSSIPGGESSGQLGIDPTTCSVTASTTPELAQLCAGINATATTAAGATATTAVDGAPTTVVGEPASASSSGSNTGVSYGLGTSFAPTSVPHG